MNDDTQGLLPPHALAPPVTPVGQEEGQGTTPVGQEAPAPAPVTAETLSPPLRFYALIALAYAQRLATVEERLTAVEEHARAALAEAQHQQAVALADVRAQLAQLEARQKARTAAATRWQAATLKAYQDAQEDIADRKDTQDRRVVDRRARDAGWTTLDRRVADRRAQQDRDRFEDAVMAQYVPPRPAAPHVAAPHVAAPHVAAPHVATPRVAAPPPNVAAPTPAPLTPAPPLAAAPLDPRPVRNTEEGGGQVINERPADGREDGRTGLRAVVNERRPSSLLARLLARRKT